MTASTDDVRTNAQSWVCISPRTCVRCSDVVDEAFVANKFACSCVYVENGAPCVHQELIDGYKSRLGTENGPRDPPQACESEPSTSTFTGYCKPNRRKSRRKIQPILHHQASPTHTHVDCQEMKSLHSRAATCSTSPPEPCQLSERLADGTESESSSSSSTTSRSSSSSSSESCNSSSTSSTDPSSSSSATSCEPVDEANTVNGSSEAARIESRLRRRRGYKIMDERPQSGCTSSDEENAGDSPSAGSESDVSSSDDSTSASSDDSWWQTYEREKDILFLKQNDLMKDSGYVSTTSPNTDSTKTDD